MKISNILAREVLDSRGNPTVEVDIKLQDGAFGRAIVPSGASTGEHEAVELRDGDKSRYLGLGVKNAVLNVNTTILNNLKGLDASDQQNIDNIMIELDGSTNKNKLGANAILGVSMAIARASAISKRVPLYKYLGGKEANLLPIPMMNILNGGSHADNNVDIQEFMLFPIGADSFSAALQMGAETFHQLKSVLKQKGLNTSVGDEGGFSPNLRSNAEAIDFILEAIEKTTYSIGKEMFLALDVASSEFYNNGKYHLISEKKKYTSDNMIEYLKSLVDQYPIVSIEDGLDQNDWEGWHALNKELGSKCQIVGDDLTVTSISHLQRAINEKSMNAILIKLNQVGSVSETIDAIKLAKANNYAAIVSHRSGETEDTTISDFSVAMGMGQIKTGSLSRTDRIAKYNQLLRIEEELGSKAKYPDIDILGRV
ncbi:phosphopyruvate hydratase [Candidatus Marinimicrobia bacterium]|nr:phosphopyruvate hydratase [Candidatus Neomarinimicrobiota bacterium]